MAIQKTPITITAPKGLVPYLKQEVSDLQFPILWASETAVGTEGCYADCMYLNLWLRTAHHVLFQLQTFSCGSLDDLYRSVTSFPWETVIDASGFMSIVSTVNHPSIRDHRIVNLKCKDAIVDRIVAKKGRRPDSGADKTSVVLTVFWHQDRCSVSIDTSGEPLSKRGYRKIPLAAPMQETLAAGIVLATGYKGEYPFLNPMCGSGTLAIEAALMGTKTAPGLMRSNFGFMHTLYFEDALWKKMCADATSRKVPLPLEYKVRAGDKSSEAIDAAKQNAVAARVDHDIVFSVEDFADTEVPGDDGVVVMNPEYGIRLGSEDELIATYNDIGRFMKHSCMGYKGYVFTGNTTLAGKIGLKARRKINFQSGKIECRLYEYELFKGSRT